jgi:hypothetical protein
VSDLFFVERSCPFLERTFRSRNVYETAAIQRPHNTDPRKHRWPVLLCTRSNASIAACGGNARNAVKALLVTNEFLEAQIAELQAAVSNGYARGKFEPVPRDRED